MTAGYNSDSGDQMMTENSAHEPPESRLAELRATIERIDRALIALIAERVAIAREIAPAKRAANLPTLDPAREAAVLRRASELAREAGLSPDDVRDIFWHVIAVCRKAQLEEESK